VSANENDDYLDALEEPKRATLSRLRETIVAIVPDAEQGISYGVPAFKVGGKTIAGFAAFKNHLSYLPHSGSVIPSWPRRPSGTRSRRGRCTSRSTSPCPRRSCGNSWPSEWLKPSASGSEWSATVRPLSASSATASAVEAGPAVGGLVRFTSRRATEPRGLVPVSSGL